LNQEHTKKRFCWKI